MKQVEKLYYDKINSYWKIQKIKLAGSCYEFQIKLIFSDILYLKRRQETILNKRAFQVEMTIQIISEAKKKRTKADKMLLFNVKKANFLQRSCSKRDSDVEKKD